MATSERGEITITLDGADYSLRPTFEACSKIEELTGKSLLELAIAAQDKSLHLKEQAIIVAECVRAFGKAEGISSLIGVQASKFGELIFHAGVIGVTPRLEILLAGAITGGFVPEEGEETGEPQAATEKANAAA